jgi:hypothetical protein
MLRGLCKQLLSLPVVRRQEVACDSQHQQSALGAGRRTKINSSNPSLPAVCTGTRPTIPQITSSDPPLSTAPSPTRPVLANGAINQAGRRQCGIWPIG